ncbi:MAG: tryptophan synthase subunit beta, partial [Lacticaseibacillus paracasei]
MLIKSPNSFNKQKRTSSMKTLNETTQQSTRAGRYGKDFGGQYIPETLMTELEKV